MLLLTEGNTSNKLKEGKCDQGERKREVEAKRPPGKNADSA